jgi:hypothetical protein
MYLPFDAEGVDVAEGDAPQEALTPWAGLHGRRGVSTDCAGSDDNAGLDGRRWLGRGRADSGSATLARAARDLERRRWLRQTALDRMGQG